MANLVFGRLEMAPSMSGAKLAQTTRGRIPFPESVRGVISVPFAVLVARHELKTSMHVSSTIYVPFTERRKGNSKGSHQIIHKMSTPDDLDTFCHPAEMTKCSWTGPDVEISRVSHDL